ncbi:alternative ribosome rescue aminoacyl-tRNA hydrolase ArfB [Ahrensia sp. R2A130]|uniref:alternative ribosome rescue aminoacyl-tRNA hydrolase ArfB n=1 Tax=Ahrensia sp. R2A130 TaxID=744979 RepID=UPI0001E0AC9C|nr:alternative ribosome rescue aminoacyl-tRNA hydrolase ArfB [Ahrensia sp. R2A130]EFL89709.1 class I peptide chain release factor [Ahrensia sp. R2A130]
MLLHLETKPVKTQSESMAETFLKITNTISISESDIEERFVQAGGPGGQAVNKLSTAVQLRFNPRDAGMPERVIVNAERIAGSRWTQDGNILLQVTNHRSRERNRIEARERLVEILKKASAPPPKKRRPTRPSLTARKKRMDSKTKRGSVKKLRGRVSSD